MSADSSNGNSDEISFMSQYNQLTTALDIFKRSDFMEKKNILIVQIDSKHRMLIWGQCPYSKLSGKSSSNLIFKTADKDTGDATERMIINYDGNVGIGTSNPTAKLHIETPDQLGVTTQVLNFKNASTGGGGGYGIFADSQSVNAKGNTLEFKSRDWNGGANSIKQILSLWPHGNVGIGWDATAGPDGPPHSQKLYVDGNTAINGRLDTYGGAYINGTIDHVAYSTGIHLGTVTGSPHRLAAEFCGTDDSESDVMIDFARPGADRLGRIYYHLAQNYMAFDTAQTERLRIDSLGNIGIGTTTPTSKLDVHGDIKMGDSAFNGMIYSGDINWGMKIQHPQGTDQYYTDLRFHSLDGTTNDRQFRVVDTRDDQPKLVVSGYKGNVGIGTDNPRNKLEIIDHGASISLGDYTQGGFPGSRNIGVFDLGGAPGANVAIPLAGMEIENTTLGGHFSQKLHFKTHHFANSQGRRLTIDEIGNVGIGTQNPIGMLSVGDSSVPGSDGNIVIGKQDANSGTRHFKLGIDDNFSMCLGDFGNHNNAGTWAKAFRLNYLAPENSLVVKGNGYVGIGTDTPAAPLEIATTLNHSINGLPGLYGNISYVTLAAPGVMQKNTNNYGPLPAINPPKQYYTTMWAGEGGIYTNYMRDGTAVSFSIIISGGIWSKSSNYGMVVSSDSRIKKNIETINDGSSLDIINKIELNKFDYKDPLSYLQYKKTGFVAQEVKKVLPEAVSVHKNYIPDYLQEISEKLVKNENNKWEVSVNDITFDENYTENVNFMSQMMEIP